MPAKYRFIYVNLNSNALSASGQTNTNPTFLRIDSIIASATEFKKIGGTELTFRTSINHVSVVVVYGDNVTTFHVQLVLLGEVSCPPNTNFLYYRDSDTLCYDDCPPNYIANTYTMKC